MNAHAIRVSVRKEFRALLPVWAAAAATIVLGGSLAPAYRAWDLLMPAAFLAFTLGTAALGALGAGHDYQFGTVASALSIPVARWRILLIKLSVLVPLMLSLAAAFTWASTRVPPPRDFDSAAFTVAVLFATVCLAPWLTITSRNLLAGTLFPLAIISCTMIAANLVTAYGYQLSGDASDGVRRTIFDWTMTIACVVGAPMSWRAFTRMEAIEGSGQAIDFSWPLGRAGDARRIDSRPRSGAMRLWLLAAKEFRLQQMSFALAVLFTIGWAILSAFYGHWIVLRDFPIAGAAALLYFYGIATLAGSLSSAEERQYGMLTAQALLPTSARVQFAVKTVVTFTVALVLAGGLPIALLFRGEGAVPAMFFLALGMVVVTMTAMAMYVSSVASSGVRAVAWSLAASLAAVTYGQWIARVLLLPGLARDPVRYLPFYWAASVAAALVVLAYRNHRTADTSSADVALQIAGLAAFIPASLALLLFI